MVPDNTLLDHWPAPIVSFELRPLPRPRPRPFEVAMALIDVYLGT